VGHVKVFEKIARPVNSHTVIQVSKPEDLLVFTAPITKRGGAQTNDTGFGRYPPCAASVEF
jgi:hypothetical protein